MAEKTVTRTVVVDLGRCLACRSCETACARAHAGFDDIVEALMSGARLVPRVQVIAAADRAVPVQCQHCEDAPCIEVCPSGALYREGDEGPVLTAPDKCIGCKSCVVVCPFGAVSWSRGDGTVIKCDLCNDLIEVGEDPHCVTACPTGARSVVSLEDLTRTKQREAAERTVRTIEVEQASSE